MSSIVNATVSNSTITIQDIQNDFMSNVTIQVVNADGSKFTVSHKVPKPLVDYILSKGFTKQQILDMIARKNPDIIL
jgi:hypothetical protein